MIITSHRLNALLTELIETAGPLAPVTWTANPTVADRRAKDTVSGLFEWPGMPPARVLTPESAPLVAIRLIRDLALNRISHTHRFGLARDNNAQATLRELAELACQVADRNSEVWAFLDAAGQTLGVSFTPAAA